MGPKNDPHRAGARLPPSVYSFTGRFAGASYMSSLYVYSHAMCNVCKQAERGIVHLHEIATALPSGL